MAKQKLSDEALEAKRAYRREWYRKNREKIKAAQVRYWEKKAATLKEEMDKK